MLETPIAARPRRRPRTVRRQVVRPIPRRRPWTAAAERRRVGVYPAPEHPTDPGRTLEAATVQVIWDPEDGYWPLNLWLDNGGTDGKGDFVTLQDVKSLSEDDSLLCDEEGEHPVHTWRGWLEEPSRLVTLEVHLLPCGTQRWWLVDIVERVKPGVMSRNLQRQAIVSRNLQPIDVQLTANHVTGYFPHALRLPGQREWVAIADFDSEEDEDSVESDDDEGGDFISHLWHGELDAPRRLVTIRIDMCQSGPCGWLVSLEEVERPPS